jgi:hypothetical protein
MKSLALNVISTFSFLLISNLYAIDLLNKNIDLIADINTSFNITEETKEILKDVGVPQLKKIDPENIEVQVNNYVKLYAIHSAKDLDWRRPGTLIKSTIRSMLKSKNHFMGHLAFQASCTNSLGKRVEFYTGMTTERSRNLKEVIDIHRSGYGLMILLSPNLGRSEQEYEYNRHLLRVSDMFPEFSPEGKSLNPDKKIAKKLLNHKTGDDKRQLRFIAYEVDAITCDLVENYYATYRGYKLDTVYGGLVSNPLKGHGGGCAGYGVSFLEVLGVLDSSMKEGFSRTIKLPNSLLGRPINSKNRVNMFEMLIYRGNWANAEQSGSEITFYEPNKAYHWIKDKTDNLSSEYQIAKYGNALGIIQKAKVSNTVDSLLSRKSFFSSITNSDQAPFDLPLLKASQDIFKIKNNQHLITRFIENELEQESALTENVESMLISPKNKK